MARDDFDPVAHGRAREEDAIMMKNMEDLQKLSKDNTDVMLKQFGAFSKTGQAIAAEVGDYTKTTFEEGTAALEKLIGAKSIEKVFEIQTDYARSAYEGFVTKATKIGELYADVTKEAFKPFETYVGKMAPAK